MPMIVPAAALGAARAYIARPTGNTLANPMLLNTSKPSTQPRFAFPPPADVMAATARHRTPIALRPRPSVIFVTSAGSCARFPHQRQHATEPTRQDTLTTASSVTSQVVGIVHPKNCRLT